METEEEVSGMTEEENMEKRGRDMEKRGRNMEKKGRNMDKKGRNMDKKGRNMESEGRGHGITGAKVLAVWAGNTVIWVARLDRTGNKIHLPKHQSEFIVVILSWGLFHKHQIGGNFEHQICGKVKDNK